MGTPRGDHGGLPYMSPEDIAAAQKSYKGDADGWKVNGAGNRELLRQPTMADLYEGWPEIPREYTDEELTQRMIDAWVEDGNRIWRANQRHKAEKEIG